mgnify:FL=1|jgi:hypothetical protein|tara:strand:- start:243 stop:1229 length:987 start_codon:yes stop_codon:yes gene_type:complete
MFKNLDPLDITKKPFKSFKNFTFTNNDSGSGVFLVKARSGSFQRYVSGSDAITSIVSGSTTTRYFGLPTWNMINKTFYKDSDKPYRTFGNNNPNVEHRELHTSSSVISVARGLYGEQIKPESVDLDITINGNTFTIKDDGDGNLYDNAHSASFASFKSSSFSRTPVASNGSGSEVGNVFYSQGLIVLTDTGSYTQDQTSYTLKYQATQTHYEYEYRVIAKPFEFNTTTNISATPGRSGSLTLKAGTVSMSNFLPPGDQPLNSGTGSFKTEYNATTQSLGFVTGSEFNPYVTQIGLYTDDGELAVVGKLGKPIKLSDEISTTFVVRFDV